jgi:Fic family protein
MTWNWQHADWPRFSWDEAALRSAEQAFLLGCGEFIGTIRHLGQEDREQLIVEAMSGEALTTSEIEGETLDRANVQSSIRRELGVGVDRKRVRPAEQGIAEMMVNLYRSFASPLSEATLFGWHRMLLKGRQDLDIGRYRSTGDSMQIISGYIGETKVHFEAPPASRVDAEMRRFLDWFNRTAPNGHEPFPALTRAGVAHLYFESIHPFEDGNGRIGRAISQKALAQSVGQPTLLALATTILERRRAYYDALEAASKSNEITSWLLWFADTTLAAQRHTAKLVEFLLAKTDFLDRLRGRLNPRQEKALLRMLREGPKGFAGGLSAGNYMTITGASPATATRDLADLMEKQALTRTGEKRHARYHLAIGAP